jgi:hypothetical protein
VSPVEQAVQESVPLQPSGGFPHWPVPQVSGVQPQTFGVPPPPQLSGDEHAPQSSVPPQSSEIEPQFLFFAAHVVFVQVPTPHLLGPAAPQVWFAAHVPQSSDPPQPSGAVPQS